MHLKVARKTQIRSCISWEPLGRLEWFQRPASCFSKGFPTRAWWRWSSKGKASEKLTKSWYFARKCQQNDSKSPLLDLHISGTFGPTDFIELTSDFSKGLPTGCRWKRSDGEKVPKKSIKTCYFVENCRKNDQMSLIWTLHTTGTNRLIVLN